MLLAAMLVIFALLSISWGQNLTYNDTECIFRDVKSRLSIVSQIIETTKQILPISCGQNLTHNDSECIFTDVNSHLSIVSQIIETTKQILPNGLKELCRKNMDCPQCPECKNITSSRNPMDCSDIYEDGERRDGLYDIWPTNRISQEPLRVYCDMQSNGGGWTVLQRRGDYKSPQDYFYRDWNSYKIGFGDKLKDFWIGNDNLFALTNQRPYHLRINLTDWEKNSRYAIYEEFWIADEANNYTLHVKGYNGTAGDSLSIDDGMLFTTKDRKNNLFSTNCAVDQGGAWWYRSCSLSNLNGLYLGKSDGNHKGIHWESFRGTQYSLKETLMKIRPAGFNAKSPE